MKNLKHMSDKPLVITQKEEEQIQIAFLSGEKSERELSSEYDLSKRQITDILTKQTPGLLEVQKHLSVRIARETNRIMELKDDALTFCQDAMREVASSESSKIEHLRSVNDLLDKVDKISRLNRGEATERSDNTNTTKHIDVNKLMETLDTDEKKREFLLKQLYPKS